MKKLIAFLLMSAMLLASFSLVGCNIDLSLDEPTDNGEEEMQLSPVTSSTLRNPSPMTEAK